MLRWFEEGGNNSDVVISSRVRLARNINGYNFSYKMSDTDAKKLVKNVTDQLKTVSPISGYNSYNFDYLDAYQKMGMRERHVISPYLEKQDYAAGFVAPDEDVSIMINEEDHIRIQAFAAGMNMQKAYTLADKMDDVIGDVLDYSYDQKFGYLTTLPSNAGTGMRASYMLHLPLVQRNNDTLPFHDNLIFVYEHANNSLYYVHDLQLFVQVHFFFLSMLELLFFPLLLHFHKEKQDQQLQQQQVLKTTYYPSNNFEAISTFGRACTRFASSTLAFCPNSGI